MKKVFTDEYFIKLFKKYYPDCEGFDEKSILEYFRKNRKILFARIWPEKMKIAKKWRVINKEYFDWVSKITGHKWTKNKYKCYVSSSYIAGGGYQKPDMVFVFPFRKDVDSNIIIAHELFHLHFFDVVNEIGFDIDEKKLWDISEVVVVLVLSEIKIKNFVYKPMIYPQHKDLYKELKLLWKKRKSFGEFLISAVNQENVILK
jgi:hypothetical protein